MCGRLNVIDNPALSALCEQLEIEIWPNEGIHFSRYIGAANPVSIVHRVAGYNQMVNATWWLLLDKTHDPLWPFKPSKYTSFNTRYDKLNVPRSAGYKAFRESRCVIPVSGFGESQQREKQALYTDFLAKKPAMLLGGLFREWSYINSDNEPATHVSCSVVTLPPHEKLMPFHEKASPLMLSLEDGSAQRWLDLNQSPESLNDLLSPTLRHSMYAQRIDKPSSHVAIGKRTLIEADG